MLCMIKEDSPVREDDVSFLTSLAVWIRGHVPSGQDAFLWLRFWHQTMSIHVARDLYTLASHRPDFKPAPDGYLCRACAYYCTGWHQRMQPLRKYSWP
jgi:hypothetical protein